MDDLFGLVQQEFKKLQIPINRVQFNIEPKMHTMDPNSFSLYHDNINPTRTVEFVIATENPEVCNCLGKFACNITTEEIPFRSFEEMENSVTSAGPPKYERKVSYMITITFPLEDNVVFNFIKDLRASTKSLLREVFDREFNKEVEDHLGKEGYNIDTDGHK